MDDVLDSARVLGLLEALRPNGLSFRQAESEGSPFPPRIEAVCRDALVQAGLSTGRLVSEHLNDDSFTRLLTDFASRRGISAEEVSHLAVLEIAIASKDPTLMKEQFPDLLDDSVLRDLLGV